MCLGGECEELHRRPANNTDDKDAKDTHNNTRHWVKQEWALSKGSHITPAALILTHTRLSTRAGHSIHASGARNIFALPSSLLVGVRQSKAKARCVNWARPQLGLGARLAQVRPRGLCAAPLNLNLALGFTFSRP